MPDKCIIDSCERPKQKRDWCDAHYRRGMRSGQIKAISKLPDASSKRCSSCEGAVFGKQQTCFKCQKRKYNFAKKYEIPQSQIADFLDAIQGHCEICLAPASDSTFGVLCVDHSHDSGQIRGLLCSKCNLGLGNFRDNKILLSRALIYLEKNND